MDGLEQFRIWLKYSRLTATLIAISSVIALLSSLGRNYQFLDFLFYYARKCWTTPRAQGIDQFHACLTCSGLC